MMWIAGGIVVFTAIVAFTTGYMIGLREGWADARQTVADMNNAVEIAKEVKQFVPHTRIVYDEKCVYPPCPNHGKACTDPCPIRLCDH